MGGASVTWRGGGLLSDLEGPGRGESVTWRGGDLSDVESGDLSDVETGDLSGAERRGDLSDV